METPDEVLAGLISRGGMRTQRREGLQQFHQVCKVQAESSRDFSRPAIARLCHVAGIAHPRMLYNGSAGEYMVLLEAWQAHCGKPIPKAERSASTTDWISNIDNPSLRQLVSRIKKERDSIQAELNLLKSSVAITVHWTANRPTDENEPLQIIETIQLQLQLSASEREALEDAISQQLLEREGWVAGRLGDVKNGAGRQIFRPAFLTAVKRVLAQAGRSSTSPGSR